MYAGIIKLGTNLYTHTHTLAFAGVDGGVAVLSKDRKSTDTQQSNC